MPGDWQLEVRVPVWEPAPPGSNLTAMLYHTDDTGATLYWRVLNQQGETFVHTGEVGFPGTTERTTEPLERLTENVRKQGYVPRIDWTPLLVRWADAPASPDDVHTVIEVAMEEVGGGHVETVALEGTRLTVRCETVEPRLVMARLVDRLHQRNWLYTAVIAARHDDGNYRTLYPPPYGQPFSVT